ncbi:MAG: hypothetical protein WBE96_13215, partial [Pseudolabrys sp.]
MAESPLLALSGHLCLHRRCPLLGVKRHAFLHCKCLLLRVRKKLSALNPGDLIVAECTDPLTTIDIPNLLRQTGDTLEE